MEIINLYPHVYYQTKSSTKEPVIVNLVNEDNKEIQMDQKFWRAFSANSNENLLKSINTYINHVSDNKKQVAALVAICGNASSLLGNIEAVFRYPKDSIFFCKLFMFSYSVGLKIDVS